MRWTTSNVLRINCIDPHTEKRVCISSSGHCHTLAKFKTLKYNVTVLILVTKIGCFGGMLVQCVTIFSTWF